MSSYVVQCPYCNTQKNVTQNSIVTCPSCGAILHIDNCGEIKMSKSGKNR